MTEPGLKNEELKIQVFVCKDEDSHIVSVIVREYL